MDLVTTMTDQKSVISGQACMCWLLSLALSFYPAAAAYPSMDTGVISQSDRYEDSKARLDKAFQILGKLKLHLDRSQFDLNALLDTLDYDHEKIISYVKEDIAFEQYPGVLRGARGTLMSRAGNSLDQSLLLATLLKDSGLDARIATTALTTDQAELLLGELLHPRLHIKTVGDEEELATLVGLLGSLTLGEDSISGNPLNGSSGLPENSMDALLNKLDEEVKFILRKLEENSIELSGAPSRDVLVEEILDYYFVEVRDGPTQGWQAVHPTFHGPVPDDFLVKPSKFFDGAIPTELQHRLKLEVLLTAKTGSKENAVTLLTWERPVANLIGRPLSYTNISKNSLSGARAAQRQTGSPESELFLPSFNGNVQNDAFDLRGNVVPSDVAGSMYAAVFKTVSNKFANAAESLFGLSGGNKDDNRLQILSDLRVRYSLIDPAGEVQDYQRTIYNLEDTGDPLQNYNLALKHLTRHYTIAIGAGRVPPAFAFDQLLDDFISRKDVLDSLLKLQFGLIDVADLAGAKFDTNTQNWIGHHLLEQAFGGIDQQHTSVLHYQSGPSIVVHSRELPFGDRARESIDIVARPYRAFDRESLKPLPQQVMRLGVWDTLVEGSLFGSNNNRYTDTSKLFDRARELGSDFVIILPNTKHDRNELHISKTIARNLDRDLKDGNVLIFPTVAQSTQDAYQAAWWRVHPTTGMTLGIGGTGEGLTSTEWLIIRGVLAAGTFGVCYVGMGGSDASEDDMLFCAGAALTVSGLFVGLAAHILQLPTGLQAFVSAFIGIVVMILKA